jgi:hypothetical protein
MPTTRQRRRRPTQYSTVVQALLVGEPVTPTVEARAELGGIIYFGWSDFPELPNLPALANAEYRRLFRE